MVRSQRLFLTDVQVILGHAHLTTTQVYLVEDDDEILRRVHRHLADRNEAAVAPKPLAVGYDADDLAILLGGCRAVTSDVTAVAAVPLPRAAAEEERFIAPVSRVGPLDQGPPAEVLTAVVRHAERMGYSDKRQRDLRRGVPIILTWLASHPGGGWQERWPAANADADLGWLSTVPAGSTVGVVHRRATNVAGIASLLLNQVILPSHGFLAAYSSLTLFRDVWRSIQPDVFHRILQQAKDDGMVERRLIEGMSVLSKLVPHTGRGPDRLTPEDFEDFRHWDLAKNGLLPHGIYPARDLLRGIGILPKAVSYKAFQHQGQRPTTELVDRYQLRCKPVRDALVRYLEERRADLDYVSFQALIIRLVSCFWADIEAHHPEVNSLQLPEEVAMAWKERMKYVTKRTDKPRPRKGHHHVLVQVRSFYLDIQEWVLEDPSWAPHAVPSPVRRGDTDGLQKHRRRTRANMHQRFENGSHTYPCWSLQLNGTARVRKRCWPQHEPSPSASGSSTTASPTRGSSTKRGRGTRTAPARKRSWSRTWPPARRPICPRPRTMRSGPGRSSKRFGTPGSAAKNYWRSPTCRWCPTALPTPANSFLSCRSCRRRAMRNGCC